MSTTMENDEVSPLDPDSYELVYVCNICNGISTKPTCVNDHSKDVSISNNEPIIKSSILSNNKNIVDARKNNRRAKICAVIPGFVNPNYKPAIDYLCSTCGEFSPDIKCKKTHVIKTLKDTCNLCGITFESIEKMMRHRTSCSSSVDQYFTNSRITIVPSSNNDRMMYNVEQSVALYLPKNFANMVQKGSLGLGRYKVVTALIDTNNSKKENIKPLSKDDFDSTQDILEWDDSMDLAILNVEDSFFEKLDFENFNESLAPSELVQMEPTKCGTSNNKCLEQKLTEKRKLICCVTCKMELLDLDTLVLNYLSNGPTFTCQFCSRHYSSSHWFKLHMQNHLNELPIVCHFCDDLFASKKIQEKHQKKVHNLGLRQINRSLLDNLKTFMCRECGKWLKSEKKLESHRQMHDVVERSTQSHIRANDKPVLEDDTKKRSLPIDDTDTNSFQQTKRKSIESFESIRQHMMSHDANRQNKCEGCNERPPTTEQMQQHKCLRYESNACTECSKVFSNAAGLPCHLKTDHQAETISCDLCQSKFKMLSSYLIHRSRQH